MLPTFQHAADCNACTIPVSLSPSVDGVPFLMHDNTLRRTTDVEKIFPDRQVEDASFFNWTDLRQLSAGQWFLEVEESFVETFCGTFFYFSSSDVYGFFFSSFKRGYLSYMILNIVIYPPLSLLLEYDPNPEKTGIKSYVLASLPKLDVNVPLCCERMRRSLHDAKVPFRCHDRRRCVWTRRALSGQPVTAGSGRGLGFPNTYCNATVCMDGEAPPEQTFI